MNDGRWWNPDPIWNGKDVFIIGGGPSLKGFDFSLLKDKRTIGCNTAFTLGPDICDVCVFVDTGWFEFWHDDLAKFPNTIVTNHNKPSFKKVSWLKVMAREQSGLHKHALGYGGNCGCVAINLALILGAKRVLLLGVDCNVGFNGEPNWHPHLITKSTGPTYYDEVYGRFKDGYQKIAHDLPNVFPGSEIINLNPDSELEAFKKAPIGEFLPSTILEKVSA